MVYTGSILNTVVTDGLVLKHKAISILSADYILILLDQFYIKAFFLYQSITTYILNTIQNITLNLEEIKHYNNRGLKVNLCHYTIGGMLVLRVC